MIANIEGRVSHKGRDGLVLQVGGVGIEVLASYPTIESIDADHAYLFTRLIVREDALTLYGFATETERDLFDTFIKISGIGPRLAITILSTLSVENVRAAVSNENASIIQRVPGIGKKTAEKIVFELRDQVTIALDDVPASDFVSANADVLDALTGLGYSVVEAQAAIQALPADAPEDSETRVFLALQNLGG